MYPHSQDLPTCEQKIKKSGESDKIYHVRNVMGRENLIACGRTNELTRVLLTEYSSKSFMADGTGLYSTTLQY